MPVTDLELLIEAARQSGRIATGFTGSETQRWDKPGNAGPVTEADLAVNNMLEDMLPKARPDYGWLSEESEDNTARLSCERVFIIDPIDGTRSFAGGSRTWAHALAVADKGEVIAAVIYLPQRDLLYAASKGSGATCNGKKTSVSDLTTVEHADVLAARPALEPHHWKDGAVPSFKRSHRPSLAYRMARVAEGRFDAMLTLRPSWEWDIAAGDLIIRESGGNSTDRRGMPLKFNNPKPLLNGVVAANPTLHGTLINALAASGAPKGSA